MCVCARVHSLGYPHTVTPCLEVQGPCWNQGRMPPKKLGVPSLWLRAASDKLPFAYLLLLSQSLALKILHGGLEKGLIRKINTSLFALKMETAGLKASVWKVILQMSWKLVCFLNQRGRPKGMHCVPLIYQLPECPNPLLCSPLFLHFPTLITYLHLQHSFPTDGNITMLLVSSKNTSG